MSSKPKSSKTLLVDSSMSANVFEVPDDIGVKYFEYVCTTEVIAAKRTCKKVKSWVDKFCLTPTAVLWESFPPFLVFPLERCPDVYRRLFRLFPNVTKFATLPGCKGRLEVSWQTPGRKIQMRETQNHGDNAVTHKINGLPSEEDLDYIISMVKEHQEVQHPTTGRCYLHEVGDYEFDLDAMSWFLRDDPGAREDCASLRLPSLESLSVRVFDFPVREIATAAPNLTSLALFNFDQNVPRFADFALFGKFLPNLCSLTTDFLAKPDSPFELPNLTSFALYANNFLNASQIDSQVMITMLSQLPVTLRSLTVDGLYDYQGPLDGDRCVWNGTWIAKVWSRFTMLENAVFDHRSAFGAYGVTERVVAQLPSLTKLQEKRVALSKVYHMILLHKEESMLPKVKALSRNLRSATMCACMTTAWPDVVTNASNLTHLEIRCDIACQHYRYTSSADHDAPPLVVYLRSANRLRSLTLSSVVLSRGSLVGFSELRSLEEFRLHSVALTDSAALDEIGVSLPTSNLKVVEIEFDPKVGTFLLGPHDITRLLAAIGSPLEFFSLCQVTRRRIDFRTSTACEWLPYTPSSATRVHALETFEEFALAFLELLKSIDRAILPRSCVLFGPGGPAYSVCQVIDGELWRCQVNGPKEYEEALFDLRTTQHKVNHGPGWRSFGDALNNLRQESR